MMTWNYDVNAKIRTLWILGRRVVDNSMALPIPLKVPYKFKQEHPKEKNGTYPYVRFRLYSS